MMTDVFNVIMIILSNLLMVTCIVGLIIFLIAAIITIIYLLKVNVIDEW